MPVKFKNLTSVDLKRDSTVQYTKIYDGVEGPPPQCVATPEAHPVLNTTTDNFPGARACIQSADWRPIAATGPNTPIASTNGQLIFTPNVLGSTCVGGIRTSVNNANNWYVRAVKQSVTIGVSGSPDIWCLACVSQANPLDPNPLETTGISFFAAAVTWSSGIFPNERFQFRLFRHVAGGAFTTVGAGFLGPAGFWSGPGHSFGIRVLCNNGVGNNLRLQLLIDDVVTRDNPGIGSFFFLPAGKAGIGSLQNSQTASQTVVSSWTADELAD